MKFTFSSPTDKRAGAVALCLVGVLLATLASCWPALTGPFLFDDFPNLENLAALNGRLDIASLAHYASLYRSEPGRPLSMLSFVINDFAWPSDPWPFKYTNLMLHLLIGTLVFGFARTLAKLRSSTAPSAEGIALLTAAAWLLHPIQLSTSMLVVQRMTQMSALFSVAALWAYVATAQRAHRPLIASVAIASLGVGTILAVLSKETGALTPLLALIINFTLLHDRLKQLPSRNRWAIQWAAILPVVAVATVLIFKFGDLTNYGRRSFDMSERLLSEARALCDYLFNILVPNLRGGGIYHDDFEVSRTLFIPWSTFPAVLGIVGLIVFGFRAYRRHPVLSFGILWYFGAHLLESTVFPLELYFEHRNYLPMFGVVFTLSAMVHEWAVRIHRRWPLILAWIWIGFAAWLTTIQAPIWGNRDALVLVWAIEHPNSARAVQEKSAYYYRHGEYSRAGIILLDSYKRGVRGADFPLQALLLACVTHDEALSSRARLLLSGALKDDSFSRAMFPTLSKFRRQVQNDVCPEILDPSGWLAISETLLANPKYSVGSAAGYIHIERAYLYRHRRDLNSTMRELEAAWEANPTPDLAHLMAVTLVSAGLYDDARLWAERGLMTQARGVRGWFSQDDVLSGRLLDALEHISAAKGTKSAGANGQ